jgi:hypothetical protein
MSDFKRITINRPDGLIHKYAPAIIAVFQQISMGYIFEKREARKPNSNSIKYNMVKLGHQLGFRVYANGLTDDQLKEQREEHGFVNREFLFDIHWYIDKKNAFYIPEKISLVAESELGDRRKGDTSRLRNPAVMFDFQKLLAANAELRLMVFKVRYLKELDALNNYFDEAIASYELLQKGDAFLFLCFVHDAKELFYSEKSKL